MGIHSYIARQFGNPAGFGGKLVAAVMNRQNHPLYDATERLLSPDSGDRILDIGCGNGYVLERLAGRRPGDYTGIDISPSILKAAARRNRRFVSSKSMSFVCCRADDMPFDTAVFDKAFAVNAVYFWDDLDGAMAEIKRVLKPGGLFVNTLYTRETLARIAHTRFGYRRCAAEQLTGAASGAGFKAEIVPILHDAAYCVVCRAPSE